MILLVARTYVSTVATELGSALLAAFQGSMWGRRLPYGALDWVRLGGWQLHMWFFVCESELPSLRYLRYVSSHTRRDF